MHYRRLIIFLIFIVVAIFFLTAWLTHQNQNLDQDLAQYKQRAKITAGDNGKMLNYNIAAKFTIELDQNQYPKENLSFSCQPEGIIGKTADAPAASSSDYAVEFRALAPGVCHLKDSDFFLTLRVWASD